MATETIDSDDVRRALGLVREDTVSDIDSNRVVCSLAAGSLLCSTGNS